MSELFPLNVGLRRGCVKSPRLLNVYMGAAVQEMNACVLGERAGTAAGEWWQV